MPYRTIQGKPATNEEIAAYVGKLLAGDPKRKIPAMKKVEIQKMTGWSRPTIDADEKLAKELKLIEVDENGKIIKAKPTHEQQFREFSESHPILNDPVVSAWYEDMQNRKRGKGIKSRDRYVGTIQKICNTCKVSPSLLVSSTDAAEEIKKNFMLAFREKRVIGQMNYNRDVEILDYELSYAIANICDFHHVTWNKNSSKMPRKVVGHGDHADIRLTSEEFEEADRYLIRKFGIDSDIYRIFWVGVESCARNNALYSMPLIFTKSVNDKTGSVTYLLQATETKADHIKGGKWTKYVKRPNTQKSLDLLRDRGCPHIWENPEKITEYAYKDWVKEQLLDLYEHLGKIHDWRKVEKHKRDNDLTKTGNYWLDHYTHVLRHIGAHYWLEKTNYNYGVVAKIGGWNVIDELKKSYGEMPPEMAMKILDDIGAAV